MRSTLTEAFTTGFSGLKVIVAEGECQLERQRRIKPWLANLLKKGKRVGARQIRRGRRTSAMATMPAIRLSGCPTLTLKDNPDPLKVDPVATVIDGCVGCGLCGLQCACGHAVPLVSTGGSHPEPALARAAARHLRHALVRALQPA